MNERQSAAAAERNKGPILGVLRRVLPDSGLVLEIASGTGQHVVHFARALPDLEWQPSDPDPQARSSIAAWTAHEGLSNVRPPLDLDVRSEPWPIERADAVICINMIHISPWVATLRMMSGAARLLPMQGVLFLYGPFRRSDQETAPNNEAFDAQLRRQNPEWGVRDLETVQGVAKPGSHRVLRDACEQPVCRISKRPSHQQLLLRQSCLDQPFAQMFRILDRSSSTSLM